uniref:Uncharacterized protein n=1 Tax=Psilocybe cubensis TaxID=181762 RepID=A0A8H7XKG2_PSICU
MSEKVWTATTILRLPEEVDESLVNKRQGEEIAGKKCSASMLESSSNLDISGGTFVASAGDYVHHEHKNTFIVMPPQAIEPCNSSESYIKSLEKRLMDAEAFLSLIAESNALGMSNTLKPEALSSSLNSRQGKSAPDYGVAYIQKSITQSELEQNSTVKESHPFDTFSPKQFLDGLKTAWESYVHPEGDIHYSTNPLHPSHWVNRDDTICTFPILTCAQDGFSSFEESFGNLSMDENLSPPSFGNSDEENWKAWRDSWSAWHAYWTAVYASWTSWTSWIQWTWTPPTFIAWKPFW